MKPKYITYREKNDDGIICYFILQRSHPNYVGVVSLGPLENVIACSPMPGYKLYVCYEGCLQGYFMSSFSNSIQEVESVIFDMANWYVDNRIKLEPKKYEKFKI